ncbi:Fic family protein [Candidatus Spongiihabitans sp.]|uniref:Fic family protein n=1 Tax=Candidatus Spongiihabitans sp. TaxID=3101308 RepID=UPI003C7B1BD7
MSFEHLMFKRHWDLSEETIYKLGRCKALVDCIADVPLSPEVKRELKLVSLRKGIQATTAIEGNTLSEEDIEKIMAGEHLSESKAYQEQEVKNITDAMNEIVGQIHNLPEIITPEFLQDYHRLVGKGLSAPFGAVPGQFAQSQRVVGSYRCPPPGRKPDQVEGLVKRMCDWLQKEFKFVSGKQSFMDGIVQAIVTHVYIELIHPFDDGNGRTGRLIEFYLLLRAGVPDICAHILSNHYNTTRPEYYNHLKKCQEERNLTSFIDYAVTGFFDGIKEVWDEVAIELLEKAWRGHVYDKFAKIKWSKPSFKRRRRLLLEMSLFESYNIEDIPYISPKISREYARVSLTTLHRDIKSLIDAKLLVIDPKTKKISANTDILTEKYPERRQ